MVLNATYNNISAISWRSVLLVPTENHRPVTDKLYHKVASLKHRHEWDSNSQL